MANQKVLEAIYANVPTVVDTAVIRLSAYAFVRVTGNVHDPENNTYSHIGKDGNSGNRLELLNFVNTSAVW